MHVRMSETYRIENGLADLQQTLHMCLGYPGSGHGHEINPLTLIL